MLDMDIIEIATTLRLRPTGRCNMNVHSRRHSLLGDARNVTVKFTASLAERIPVPIHVGSGHYMATTVLRSLAAETHERRLIHSRLCLRENSQIGTRAFCLRATKLDSFGPTSSNEGL